MSPETRANLEFCRPLITLIEAGESIGRSGKTLRNSGSFSTPNTLAILRNLFLAERPTRTLETGLGFGASALVFGASHRELTGTPAHQHTAIDPHQRGHWDEVALVALENAGLRDYVDFREQSSSIALPQLLAEREKFQLIYVDGSHLFEDVFLDAYFASRLLVERGVLVFDDSTDPHVRKVLHFIRSNLQTVLQPLNLGPYRSARNGSTRYRLASLLQRAQLTAFRKIGSVERPWNAEFADF